MIVRRAAAFLLCLVASIAAAAGAVDRVQLRGRDLEDTPPERWSDEEFGARLFFDRRLSADGSISCASCHQPAHAFSDPRPMSTGVHSAMGQRHAPSLLDVADRPHLFWDGRVDALEQQVRGPLSNPREQGLSVDGLARIVRADAAYAAALQGRAARRHSDADPQVIMQLVATALAAYERTLRSPASTVDRLVQGVTEGIPPGVQRGFEIFRGAGQCVACHRVEGARPALTDEAFHPASSGLTAIALRALPDNARHLAEVKARHEDVGELLARDGDAAALGRFAVTLIPADAGLFRTPSLRVVASTAPYMHDGSVPTLRAAVETEAYRRVDGLRRPIALTAAQVDDLVEFLASLKAQTTVDKQEVFDERSVEGRHDLQISSPNP